MVVAGRYLNHCTPNNSSGHKNISNITGNIDGTLKIGIFKLLLHKRDSYLNIIIGNWRSDDSQPLCDD